jgi:alkanesulfonate monooxygenase SsuD/methylene tetrahydromethanopterin reductase-like flavin-dependent oxidoreductase (luciferase family)
MGATTPHAGGTDPVRFAIRLPQSWCVADRDAIVAVAELADELDMDVSVQDHLLSDGSVSPCGPDHDGEDRAVYEAHTTLAFVAARTRRARLIAGVYVLPFRHPVWLAKETASLDALSGGRLVVGVGVGALRARAQDRGQDLRAHGSIASREFDAFGVQGHRGRMMDEYLRVLDALWTREAATFEGEFVRFHDLDIYPKPEQRPRPPIWVGGRSEAAQDRAARLGDAWYPSQPPVAVVAAGRDRIARVAAEAGRPAPGLAVNIFASVDADRGRARDALRASIGKRFTGDDPLFDAALAGSPDDVRAQVQAYVEVGVRAFDLKVLPLTLAATLEQLRLLAAEVAPAFR